MFVTKIKHSTRIRTSSGASLSMRLLYRGVQLVLNKTIRSSDMNITLFKSITLFSWTDNILQNIPHIQPK